MPRNEGWKRQVVKYNSSHNTRQFFVGVPFPSWECFDSFESFM
jgi:hypothetical protein